MQMLFLQPLQLFLFVMFTFCQTPKYQLPTELTSPITLLINMHKNSKIFFCSCFKLRHIRLYRNKQTDIIWNKYILNGKLFSFQKFDQLQQQDFLKKILSEFSESALYYKIILITQVQDSNIFLFFKQKTIQISSRLRKTKKILQNLCVFLVQLLSKLFSLPICIFYFSL
ncbi:hypothetical protein ABPG74_021500 [Tetrahymena malaccensis]